MGDAAPPMVKRLRKGGWRMEVPVDRETGEAAKMELYANYSKDELLGDMVVKKLFGGSVEEGVRVVMEEGKVVEDAVSRKEKSEQVAAVRVECEELAYREIIHKYTGENFTPDEWSSLLKSVTVKYNTHAPASQYLKLVKAVCCIEEYAIRRHAYLDISITDDCPPHRLASLLQENPDDMALVREGSHSWTVLVSMPLAKKLVSDSTLTLSDPTFEGTEQLLRKFSTHCGATTEATPAHPVKSPTRNKPSKSTPKAPTKADLIAAHEAHLNTLPVKALVDLCRPLNIPSSGKKSELIERLMVHYETKQPRKMNDPDSDSD